MRSFERHDLPGHRAITITGGYDCIATPCGIRGCGERPGASHGIGSAYWGYIVGAGTEAALVLTVDSGLYPWTSSYRRLPNGIDMTLHLNTPADGDDKPEECGFVRGGRCYGLHTSCLAARDFYVAHAVGDIEPRGGSLDLDVDGSRVVPPHEQPERFWRALEHKRREWLESYWPTAAPIEEPLGRCFKCGESAVAYLASPRLQEGACPMSGAGGQHMWGAP